MTGIFITSTGTGIGKTYLTKQLLTLDSLRSNVLTVSKPLISGWPTEPDKIHETDTAILLSAQQKALTPSHIDALSPWRFTAPLSPDMAAKREGRSLDLDQVIAHSQQKILEAKKHQKIHLIEGVGGVMVPLHGAFTVLDWIEQVGCPCLLVVGSYLGTLSHTLTAIRVLEMKQIPILAIVVNETVGSSVSLYETTENLQALLPYPLFELGYQAKPEGVIEEAIDSLYSEICTKLGQFSIAI